jgi:hypothetical protein
MLSTKPNPIQPHNQLLTLQVLASIASLDGTLPLPRGRPDAAITTNNSETLRHLAIKATGMRAPLVLSQRWIAVTAASSIRWPRPSRRKSRSSMKSENRSETHDAWRPLFLPNGDRGYRNLSLERFRTSSKYQDRPAAADIAFCVAAYGNGMAEDRIEHALSDDYLSRDPSPSKRAAYIRRTMEKARRWAER